MGRARTVDSLTIFGEPEFLVVFSLSFPVVNFPVADYYT